MPSVQIYIPREVKVCSCGKENVRCFDVLDLQCVPYCDECEALANECAELAKKELAGEDYAYLLDLPSIAIPRSDGTTTCGGTILCLTRTFGSPELCARCTAEIGTLRLNKTVSLEDLAKVNPR